MAGGIFVSYRRQDSRHAAGWLVERLGKTYAREQLFLDIDNIEPGVNFVKVLSDQVQACDVLLAVIGPQWLDSRDEKGQRRLDNPKDFVRIEIKAALDRDVRVIPVLVDGARMPAEDELPDDLKPLIERNAVRLAHERFTSDADDLTNALTKVVPPRKGWLAGLSKTAAQGAATVTKTVTVSTGASALMSEAADGADTRVGGEPSVSPALAVGVLFALGLVSGMVSGALATNESDYPRILLMDTISAFAGFALGAVLGLAFYGLFGWPIWRAAALILTTHVAWRLSPYLAMLLGAMFDAMGVAKDVSRFPTIFAWGWLGAVLTFLPVAYFDRGRWSLRGVLLVGLVGGLVLIPLVDLKLETSSGMPWNPFSIWQSSVAATIGFVMARWAVAARR